MKFHPAAQILTWCLLVAAMQALSFEALLITTCIILLCTIAISGHKFIQLVRRTRWIMVSLMLVYAYSTPGQPLLDELGMFGPSREGLLGGVLQLTRLLAALAGLAILLEKLNRQQLIAGLYTLFAPLQWLGLSRERFAVRLALTLHHAEAAMTRGADTWLDTLRRLFETHGEAGDAKQMELPRARFSVADALLLSGAMSILWLALR